MTMRDELGDLNRERAAGVSYLRRRAATPGATLVFLHGIGSSAASWAALARDLDPAFGAIFWDAPGYAGSDDLAASWPTPADYARALAALLDRLNADPVVLVGHSLGSLFAGAFAAAYPERVQSLALFSPALGYRIPPGAELTPPLQARLDNLERLGAAEFAIRSAPRLVAAPEAKPQIVARIAAIMSGVRARGYGQAVRALASGDLLADAEKIVAPALVAVGVQDTVTPPENARRLYAALPRPDRLIEVADAGHALPQEDSATAARILNEFLRTRVHVAG